MYTQNVVGHLNPTVGINNERKRSHDNAFNDTEVKKEVDGNHSRLPRELTEKFGPLNCKLCQITAGSTLSAKIHYNGKPHKKAVKRFLESWCKQTGQAMPTLKEDKTEVTQDTTYCDVCNIVLTSVSNAQEHYAGKNHKKALKKQNCPDAINSKPVPPAQSDPTGRFGIGAAFLKLKEEENPNIEVGFLQQLNNPPPPPPPLPPPPEKKNLWVCELCNVRAQREDQLKMHLQGTKHFKAAKRAQVPSIVPAPVNPSESILASVTRPGDASGTDYSMHRTPSGNYYCQPCNVTMNSPDQFSQHMMSRRHKFKYASMKRPNRNDKV